LLVLVVPLVLGAFATVAADRPDWHSQYVEAKKAAQELKKDGEYADARDTMARYASTWASRLEGEREFACPGSAVSCRAAVEDFIAKATLAAGEFAVLADLNQRSIAGDAGTSRALVRRLLKESQRRYVSRRQKNALFRTLVRHDERVQVFVNQHFPAGIRTELAPGFGLTGDHYFMQALERGGAELGLVIDARGPGVTTLVVRADIEKSDTSGQRIFKGNAMKSYGIGATIDLVNADGRVLASAVESHQVLGISVKHANQHGIGRLARGLLEALVDDILFRVYRDEL
jgi:hypothetical protein